MITVAHHKGSFCNTCKLAVIDFKSLVTPVTSYLLFNDIVWVEMNSVLPLDESYIFIRAFKVQVTKFLICEYRKNCWRIVQEIPDTVPDW